MLGILFGLSRMFENKQLYSMKICDIQFFGLENKS